MFRPDTLEPYQPQELLQSDALQQFAGDHGSRLDVDDIGLALRRMRSIPELGIEQCVEPTESGFALRLPALRYGFGRWSQASHSGNYMDKNFAVVGFLAAAENAFGGYHHGLPEAHCAEVAGLEGVFVSNDVIKAFKADLGVVSNTTISSIDYISRIILDQPREATIPSGPLQELDGVAYGVAWQSVVGGLQAPEVTVFGIRPEVFARNCGTYAADGTRRALPRYITGKYLRALAQQGEIPGVPPITPAGS